MKGVWWLRRDKRLGQQTSAINADGSRADSARAISATQGVLPGKSVGQGDKHWRTDNHLNESGWPGCST